jgi:DMSO/TMAO reductase YedYZ molybdopterin-dependent catalytic subunit
MYMKRSRTIIYTLSFFFILTLALSSCGSKATSTPVVAESTGTVLKLSGTNGGHALTMADLKTLPVTEGMGGIKSSTGKITIPEKYTGVSLKDLIAKFNIPFDATMGMTLTAEDGYSMTFSYDQIMNGSFTAYDPALGNELKNHDPLTPIIAYAKSGQPLNTAEEGTLRLAIVSEKNNEVVDGHWTVKWVNQVEVKPVGQAWMLHLHGVISQPVDRASYQSCGSPGCHGTTWMDENGQNWVGVPLWLIVGEVDDNNSHDDNAYNEALAKAGYSVDIAASDGYTVTLESGRINRNNNIILAFLVNDGELPEQYYPLRLVGTGLDKKQMVGKVETITLDLPAEATPTTAPAASSAEGTLVITGMVNQELTLTDADLHNLEVAHITAVHPKKGSQEYDGVRLNVLLDKAGVKAGATTVVFIASDGYTAEVSLNDIRACADCLLAFTDTKGSYSTVMPGMLGNAWTKNVVKLEVK